MNKQLAAIAPLSAELLGVFTIACLIGYSIMNKSGHTGLNPYLLLLVFGPLTLCGLFLMPTHRNFQINRIHPMALIAVGLIGALLIVYLDKTNTLVEYEAWLKRGMPEKGSY